MPQMSPLNWLFLYPYFLILLYCFIIMLYFVGYNYKSSYLEKPNFSSSKNWKW